MTRPEDREQFETWATTKWVDLNLSLNAAGYMSELTSVAWMAWQARAALPATVALPPPVLPGPKAHEAAPRTEAVIEACIRQYPGVSARQGALYYETVHQHLAPLCRELEAENMRLRAAIEAASRGTGDAAVER